MPVAKFQPLAVPYAGAYAVLLVERAPSAIDRARRLPFPELLTSAPKQLVDPPQFTAMSPCVTLWKTQELEEFSPSEEAHVFVAASR